MHPKERFLNACLQKDVDRPPVWMMRQAGRCLPEYRAIKAKHSTKVMMQTPHIACEVTLQPVQRFGVDAAILYSDILMIPDALGMGLAFGAGEGPKFDFAIHNDLTLNRLNRKNLMHRLSYVFSAAKLCVQHLPQEYPLLGFAGAPFTVACYMIAGKAEENFPSVFALIKNDPKTFSTLMQLLAESTLAYLIEQANAGVAAVQLFDTWAGLLQAEQYQTVAKPYTEFVLNGLRAHKIPAIHFIKNGAHLFQHLQTLASEVIGVDQEISLSDAFAQVSGRYALQGNFDPMWLKTDLPTIDLHLQNMLAEVPHRKRGYIINLGHGIDKDTPVENAHYFVRRAQELGTQ